MSKIIPITIKIIPDFVLPRPPGRQAGKGYFGNTDFAVTDQQADKNAGRNKSERENKDAGIQNDKCPKISRA